MNLLHLLFNGVNANGNGNSGNDNVVVVITKSSQAGCFVADKTRAEIAAAYSAGKKIVFLLTIGRTLYQIDDITVETDSNEEPWIVLREKGCAPHPDIKIVYGPTSNNSEMLYVTSDFLGNGRIDHVSTSATVPGTVTESMYTWEFGELTGLTITTFPEEGIWRIQFTSGSTPTELTLPQGLLGLDDFEPEANTEYVLELAFGVGYVGIPDSDSSEEEE